jgi:hypothetical protein
METPPKLSILFHTGGTLMEVTPLGEGGAKIADVAALLEKILHLLMEDPDEHLPLALEQFFTHLGVRSWEDMVVFSAHDGGLDQVPQSAAPPLLPAAFAQSISRP